MTSLVACAGTGKGTWTQLKQVIKSQEWENVFIVTNPFGAQNFSAERKLEFIIVDDNKSVFEISDDVRKAMHGKVKEFEVAFNMISGEGKLHMATLSGLLKNGLSVRLVDFKDGKVEEL